MLRQILFEVDTIQVQQLYNTIRADYMTCYTVLRDEFKTRRINDTILNKDLGLYIDM